MVGGKRLEASKSSSYCSDARGAKYAINSPGTAFVSGDPGVKGGVESVVNVMEVMLIHKVCHDVGVDYMIEVAHYENLFLGLCAGVDKAAKMGKK